MTDGKPDKMELFNHIREECVKNPFFLTRMILTAFGSNLIQFVIRIAIYMLILYPFMTSILHVPAGVAYLFVTLSIVAYYSALSIYHKLIKDVKARANVEDKNCSKGGLRGV